MDHLQSLMSLIVRLVNQGVPGRETSDLRTAYDLLKKLEIEIAAVLEEKRKLAGENVQLKSRLTGLAAHVKKVGNTEEMPITPKMEFVEHMGVLFRKRPGNRIDPVPFCQSCRIRMREIDKNLPFSCGRCHHTTSFLPVDVHNLLFRFFNTPSGA